MAESFAGLPYDRLLRLLSSDIGTVPALVWRADLVKNEISFLTDHAIPGLEEEIPRLLQDQTGGDAILAAQDRAAFARFHERLRQRQPVSEVFRAHGSDGLMRWLYILGMPDPEMTFCYLGLLADCTGLANGILQRGSETGLAAHVELFDNPVFMVDLSTRRISAANRAARHAFGLDPETAALDLGHLFAANSDAYLRDIYERLLFSRAWNGLLTLHAADGRPQVCMARVRAYDRDGGHHLWISLSPRPLPREDGPAAPPPPAPAVAEDLFRAADLRGMLEVLLTHQAGRVDAVMLSQIFIREGRVAVTGVGRPFESVAEADSHPYPGSIAENIVLFDLDHVLVADTTKSIKPIDWALFIPKGIRSYVALPCFVGGILREVVIFCSTAPHAFDDPDVPVFAGLANALWAELPRVLEGLRETSAEL
ncbi:conserved hypothetical protein [uncultured Alphaproteobacteria bacterium]|uniref:PAS domain-containing protein n=1 Tax=uncultured Alphaproteobacteria bacterium TaxID=91750 RepID=A0A212KKM4_9PROT|nr:conserved hypothetical protein [uncultured Alphaproteobacteria bacterium]